MFSNLSVTLNPGNNLYFCGSDFRSQVATINSEAPARQARLMLDLYVGIGCDFQEFTDDQLTNPEFVPEELRRQMQASIFGGPFDVDVDRGSNLLEKAQMPGQRRAVQLLSGGVMTQFTSPDLSRDHPDFIEQKYFVFFAAIQDADGRYCLPRHNTGRGSPLLQTVNDVCGFIFQIPFLSTQHNPEPFARLAAPTPKIELQEMLSFIGGNQRGLVAEKVIGCLKSIGIHGAPDCLLGKKFIAEDMALWAASTIKDQGVVAFLYGPREFYLWMPSPVFYFPDDARAIRSQIQASTETQGAREACLELGNLRHQTKGTMVSPEDVIAEVINVFYPKTQEAIFNSAVKICFMERLEAAYDIKDWKETGLLSHSQYFFEFKTDGEQYLLPSHSGFSCFGNKPCGIIVKLEEFESPEYENNNPVSNLGIAGYTFSSAAFAHELEYLAQSRDKSILYEYVVKAVECSDKRFSEHNPAQIENIMVGVSPNVRGHPHTIILVEHKYGLSLFELRRLPCSDLFYVSPQSIIHWGSFDRVGEAALPQQRW